MRFRLFYRGPLNSNGRSQEKAALRKCFHEQLLVLWNQQPLSDIRKYIDPAYKPDDCYLGEKRDSKIYYPIISDKIATVADLEILMLRPGSPGSVISGGDVDNRIKTLLDGLQPPNKGNPIPGNEVEAEDIFCLLQDDKLVTRLSVETDTLLDPNPGCTNEVVLIIRVQVMATRGLTSNIGICL